MKIIQIIRCNFTFSASDINSSRVSQPHLISFFQHLWSIKWFIFTHKSVILVHFEEKWPKNRFLNDFYRTWMERMIDYFFLQRCQKKCYERSINIPKAVDCRTSGYFKVQCFSSTTQSLRLHSVQMQAAMIANVRPDWIFETLLKNGCKLLIVTVSAPGPPKCSIEIDESPRGEKWEKLIVLEAIPLCGELLVCDWPPTWKSKLLNHP